MHAYSLRDMTHVNSVRSHRKFFITPGDPYRDPVLLGLGPQNMESGDEICMLKGGKVLYALRPAKDGIVQSNAVLKTNGEPHDGARSTRECQPPYRLLGEVYTMGLMDGEVVEMMGKHLKKAKRERPLPLKDMADEFSDVFLI